MSSREIAVAVAAAIDGEEKVHRGAELFAAVLAALGRLPDAETQRLTVRVGTTIMRVGDRQSLQAEARTLESIEHLKLRSATETVEILSFGESDGVLISRYPSCEGETLASVAGSVRSLSDESRARFHDEMRRLIKAGTIHPLARGPAHLYVSSETQTIVIEHWGAVRDAREGEGDELLERLATALGLD